MGLKRHNIRYLKPAGEDGSDTGGTEVLDRGDNWTPTEESAADIAAKQREEEARSAARETPPKDDAKPAAAPTTTAADGLRDGSGVPDVNAETTETGDKTEAKDKSGKIIPLDRHEKILAKERERREALERQLAAFQGSKAVADQNETIKTLETKVTELDGQYAKALADGDTKRASELMREIRQAERQIGDAKTQFQVAAATAAATEQARYDVALERIETSFPKLNPDHADFDEELLTDVADLKEVYQKRGMTPTKALQEAVKKLVKPETSAQQTATTVTPRVDPEKVRDERKSTAAAKTADAASRTPPNPAKVGQDSDRLGGGLNAKDVMNLPQEEFAKLKEEDLKKLRGDTL